jgi:DivIVA domain-containing protein
VLVVEIVLAAGVLLAVALVAAGRGGSMSEAQVDARDSGLPRDRLLTSDDVPRLRFRLAMRGYRMSDVDTAIDRLHDSLAAAERRAAEAAHRATQPPLEPPPPPSPPEPPRPAEPMRPVQPPRPEEPPQPQPPVVPPVQPAPRPEPPEA